LQLQRSKHKLQATLIIIITATTSGAVAASAAVQHKQKQTLNKRVMKAASATAVPGTKKKKRTKSMKPKVQVDMLLAKIINSVSSALPLRSRKRTACVPRACPSTRCMLMIAHLTDR
jgi:hypothetical protein